MDYICITDNYWLGRNKPCLTYGLRGISYFQLTLEGPSRDLHSGIYGGAGGGEGGNRPRVQGAAWPGYHSSAPAPLGTHLPGYPAALVPTSLGIHPRGFGTQGGRYPCGSPGVYGVRGVGWPSLGQVGARFSPRGRLVPGVPLATARPAARPPVVSDPALGAGRGGPGLDAWASIRPPPAGLPGLPGERPGTSGTPGSKCLHGIGT